MFIGPVVEGDFVTLKWDFIKRIGSTRNFLNMFGKPCILHPLLCLLVLLSEDGEEATINEID